MDDWSSAAQAASAAAMSDRPPGTPVLPCDPRLWNPVLDVDEPIRWEPTIAIDEPPRWETRLELVPDPPADV